MKTLRSRVSSLWRNVHESVASFEQEADTGLVPKHLTRWIHRAWNYAFRGVLGTTLLAVCSLLVCLTLSTLSLLVGCFTPLWMPLVALLAMLGTTLVYDLDSPEQGRNKYFLGGEFLWRLGYTCLVEPLAAITLAVILCPLAMGAILACAWVRYYVRSAYDCALFHMLVKKVGRVPAKESWLARRSAGISHLFLIILTSSLIAMLHHCYIFLSFIHNSFRFLTFSHLLFSQFLFIHFVLFFTYMYQGLRQNLPISRDLPVSLEN